MPLRNAFEDLATEPTLAAVLAALGGALSVQDDYQAGEVLSDQAGSDSVLTFTFTAPVNLVVIDANGETTQVARADPFGGTPSSSLGIPCRDEVPTYMPVTTTSVKVWAPSGMSVSCYGYRRA